MTSATTTDEPDGKSGDERYDGEDHGIDERYDGGEDVAERYDDSNDGDERYDDTSGERYDKRACQEFLTISGRLGLSCADAARSRRRRIGELEPMVSCLHRAFNGAAWSEVEMAPSQSTRLAEYWQREKDGEEDGDNEGGWV